MRLERGLKGWDQLLKLVESQACHIQELRGAGLQIGKLYTGHLWCLLYWEAQYIINRDNLRCILDKTKMALQPQSASCPA
jgi:hypothetical protein